MVIARVIKGHYRRKKTVFSLILLAVFFGSPLVTINGYPMILLDIAHRKFHVFGITIWPQELFLFNLVLFAAGISLFFITSLLGRMWCAYGCPQSVLTDLYDWLGKLVGGKKFGKPSFSSNRMLLVRFFWLLLSALLAFIFITYFSPYRELWTNLSSLSFSNELGIRQWVIAWIVITVFAFIVWGFFRETVCKVTCPYSRFQTAMLDEHSPIVQYDETRGEPRRQKGVKNYEGDCTTCNMCVVVCPIGIDIKDGLQVGCIHCGLCIDACIKEMGKQDKFSLVAKETQVQSEARREKELQLKALGKQTSFSSTYVPINKKPKYIRSRTAIYGSLLIIIIISIISILINRQPIYYTVSNDLNVPPTYIKSIGHRNTYNLTIGNKTEANLKVKLKLLINYEKIPIKHKNTFSFKILNTQNNYLIEANLLTTLRIMIVLNGDISELPETIPFNFLIIGDDQNWKTETALFRIKK